MPHSVLDDSFGVGTAVSQFYAVKLTDTQEVSVAGAGEACIGIMQEEISTDDVAFGRNARVRVLGVSRGVAGAAITQGALVAADAAGKLATATVGQAVVGKAVTAAAADGDWFSVLLIHGVTAA